jgi:exodeoxyribonuclease VIII
VKCEELQQETAKVREETVRLRETRVGMTLTNAEYHARPEVSKSGLDMVRRSPLHFWNRYLNPDRIIEPPTAAMTIGSALHTRVLEPHLFDDEYAVAPHCDRRTKEGKMIWADFEQEAAGKTLLKAEDALQITAMADSLRRHPAARVLLNKAGKAEQSYFWTDDETGEKCKCRPDFHTDDRRIIVDVKTTEDASPGKFLRSSVLQWRYHVQAAFYMQGVPEAELFLFAVVEKKPPFAAAVYTLPTKLVERGLEDARADLRCIAECRAADRWPGYGDEVQELSLPKWLEDDRAVDLISEIEGF